MAREPVLAAGGIVLRRGQSPRIAVVRLRKRDEWVLPKGKLDNGETARDAAEREVLEETGHDVIVHEFLGTLAYESGGRSKIVHYWRMEADGEQAYELMHDVRAVDWLPLDLAIGRLSRAYERAFLTHVGPHALENAAAAEASRRAQAKAPAAKKRRSRQAPARKPLPKPPLPAPTPQPDVMLGPPGHDLELPTPELQVSAPFLDGEILDIGQPIEKAEAMLPIHSEDAEPAQVEMASNGAAVADADTNAEIAAAASDAETEVPRPSLAQKVRAWLGRAA